jgi:hypothetical protein
MGGDARTKPHLSRALACTTLDRCGTFLAWVGKEKNNILFFSTS